MQMEDKTILRMTSWIWESPYLKELVSISMINICQVPGRQLWVKVSRSVGIWNKNTRKIVFLISLFISWMTQKSNWRIVPSCLMLVWMVLIADLTVNQKLALSLKNRDKWNQAIWIYRFRECRNQNPDRKVPNSFQSQNPLRI